MPSTWPGAVPSYTTKQNVVDVVDAAHPNLIQEDIVALATNIGVNPQIAPAPSGSFLSGAQTFPTLKARLDNIEKGIAGDTHLQYVKVAGNSTIQSTDSAAPGLVIKGQVGSIRNLLEFRTSAGTLGAYVDKDAVIRNADGGGVATAQDIDNVEALVYMGVY